MKHYVKTTHPPSKEGVKKHSELLYEFRHQLNSILIAVDKIDRNSYEQSSKQLNLIRVNTKVLLAEVSKLQDLLRSNLDSKSYDLQKGSPTYFVQEDNELLQRLHRIVLDNLENQDLDCNSLCRKIGMSRTQLYRKMKELTQHTVAKYVRSVRLKAARELLIDSTMSIGEIAFRVGFNDQSYFSRTFLDEFGVRPKEVR